VRVRKVRCPGCGAPKVTPTKHAYVYCDYCARFMDWDFQVSCETAGSALPGPQYRALQNYLRPKLESARRAGDRAALAAAHRELFDLHMRDCPATYSHRIGDPAYRAALLDRTVHGQLARELDPRCVAADLAVDTAVKRLSWDHQPDGAKCRADSFWAMYDAVVVADLTVKEIVRALPEVAPDPDETPPELIGIIRDSIIVQAWLPYLDEATADALLARTGLRPEYETLDDPALVAQHCGYCGAARQVPEGAHQAVCDACGHVGALGTPARCTHCAAPILFPVRRTTTSCGHCKAEARLVAPPGVG
jgi:hypothetical protein